MVVERHQSWRRSPPSSSPPADGGQLSSSVFGLAYYDLATGSNAAIAGLTNCTGAIAGANQVIYASAFSNLNADILYTYTKAGLSQDIVLHANLPPPTPTDSPMQPPSYNATQNSYPARSRKSPP